MALELSQIPKTISITIAAVGFEVGWQIGQMLHENFAVARKLGVGITGFMQALVNDLVFLKEAAAAVFTSDTIGAAFDRYLARGRQMDLILADMWKDAENAPTAIGSAADAGAAGLGQLAGAGTAAGRALAAGGAHGAAGLAQAAQAAHDARNALAGLATQINTKPVPSPAIEQIARDLMGAAGRGQDLERLLREKMPAAMDKLSGPELERFRSDFVVAMGIAQAALQNAMDTGAPRVQIEALRAKVEKFGSATRTGLGLIAEQAAKNLGIDVPAAFGKMSAGMKEAQNNINILLSQLPELRAAGVDTGALVGQALAKMVDGAKNQTGIDAVIARIKALRGELGDKPTDGLLEHAAQKSLALKDAMDAALPGITSVREAMLQLGITSDESLKQTAATAKDAYDTLTSSGQASARELAEAFKKSAQAAIEANNGIAPTWVQAQAAVRGYELELDRAGKTTLRLKDAVDAARASHQGAAHAMDEQARALARLNEQQERQISAQEKANQLRERELALYRQKWNIDKDSFTLNASGNRMQQSLPSANYVFDTAKGQGLDEATALALMDQYFKNGRGVGTATGMDWFSTVNKAIADAVIELARKRAAAAAAAPSPAPAPASAATSADSSTSGGTGSAASSTRADRIVNVYIGNSTTAYPVPTTASGEQNMQALAREVLRARSCA